MSEGGSSLGVLVIIGVVLVLMISVANVAHAADRTVLDDETVIETMDNEGVFASLSQELQEEITEDAERALTNEQVEPIVFEQYVEDLDTTVTVRIDGLTDAYADIVQNQLNLEALAQEAFSEAYIRDEVTRNIQQVYAYLEGDADSFALAVDLTEPRDTFIEAIESLRMEIEQNPQTIRDSIDDQTLDRLIEEEIDRLVTEELDEEIQEAAAQPGSPSEEEIEQEVRDELRLQIDAQIEDELQSPEVRQAIDSALADAQQQLETEFSEQEELAADEETPEELEDAQDALAWFGLFLWGLPLAAVALVGGGYAYTRSGRRTGAVLGGSLIGAGLLGLVIGYGLPGTVENAAESAVSAGTEMEAAVLETVLALVNTLFSAIVTQSLVLTVAGVGIVGLVYADTNGYFASLKRDEGVDQPTEGSQETYQQQYETGEELGQSQEGDEQQSPQTAQYHGPVTQPGRDEHGGTGQQAQYQESVSQKPEESAQHAVQTTDGEPEEPGTAAETEESTGDSETTAVRDEDDGRE